jgi:hypothetical protein
VPQSGGSLDGGEPSPCPHCPLEVGHEPGRSFRDYGVLVQHERALSPSPFPDDDGQATPQTRVLMKAAAAATAPADYLRAVAALCADRVLVPVVAAATATTSNAAGLTTEKQAEMSVVLLQASDGRRAMLAFTGMDSLRSWDAGARPVPVTLDLAAQSAAADGAAALLVDFAGPSSLVIEGEVLDRLARGHRLLELADGQFGWAVRQPEAQ